MFYVRFFSRNYRCCDRGFMCAGNACARSNASSNLSLLCLDTALAVSIFAALRLIIIRLIGLVISSVIVPGAVLMRPPLASAY